MGILDTPGLTKAVADATYPLFDVDKRVPSSGPTDFKDADVQAVFNARRGRLGPGVWHVSGQITAHNGCDVVLDGATIVSHYTAGFPIAQAGTCLDSDRPARPITAGATLGSSVLTTDTSGIAVDDWLMIRSDDTQENDATMKTGMLRQVTEVDATTVTIDIPLYRDLPTTPLCVRVQLAPKASITGVGVLKHFDPPNGKKAFFSSILGDSPHLGSGVTVGPHGGPGFEPTNCVNALSEASYTDLLDVSGVNFGYGVNDSGASRNTRVLGGTATRVRHAYTTNNAGHIIHPDFPVSGYGEPEDAFVGGGYTAIQCTSAGFDTHEPGRRIVMEVIAVGCQMGAQARSTDATYIIKQIVMPKLFGIHVAASAVRNTMANVQVRSPMLAPPAGAALVRSRAAFTMVSPQIADAPAGWSGIVSDTGGDITVVGGGYIAGARTGPGVVKVQSADGSNIMLASSQTDIRAALATYGLVPATGNMSLSIGTGAVNAGSVNARNIRGTATAVSDIVARFDGITGHTGDLFQARVNGSNKFTIGPTGKITCAVAGTLTYSRAAAESAPTLAGVGAAISQLRVALAALGAVTDSTVA